MCIIAAIPQGQQISKSILKRCWENNPHGGGFMYSDGNKVIIEKEMVSFKKYWKKFYETKLLLRKRCNHSNVIGKSFTKQSNTINQVHSFAIFVYQHMARLTRLIAIHST